MKNFKIYVNCEDVVRISVNENSVVEVYWDSSCRGEYWGSEGERWEGLEEIKKGVRGLNSEMEMGESGVWWIKVDGEIVYGDKEDWESWKEDRMYDWEVLKEGNGEDDEDVVRCKRLLDGLNEENWLNREYIGEISGLLSCF